MANIEYKELVKGGQPLPEPITIFLHSYDNRVESIANLQKNLPYPITINSNIPYGITLKHLQMPFTIQNFGTQADLANVGFMYRMCTAGDWLSGVIPNGVYNDTGLSNALLWCQRNNDTYKENSVVGLRQYPFSLSYNDLTNRAIITCRAVTGMEDTNNPTSTATKTEFNFASDGTNASLLYQNLGFTNATQGGSAEITSDSDPIFWKDNLHQFHVRCNLAECVASNKAYSDILYVGNYEGQAPNSIITKPSGSEIPPTMKLREKREINNIDLRFTDYSGKNLEFTGSTSNYENSTSALIEIKPFGYS